MEIVSFNGLLLIPLFWVILFSFNPEFVQVKNEGDIYVRPGTPPDPIKCFLLAVVISIVLFSVRQIGAYVNNSICV